MAYHIGFCGVVLLALFSVAYAQVDCYDCSFNYYSSNSLDSGYCGTVNSSATRVVSSCSGMCYTEITVNSNSRIELERGCESIPTGCNDCTDPNNCKICCNNTNNCNSESLLTILSSNSLTQTCYRCQYSEIPGVRNWRDAGCGLNFDSSSPDVSTVECPGMCYSSRSLIPGVDEISRGCSYRGNECDYEDDKEVVETGRDSVRHRISCCMGDKCNHSTPLSVGLATIIIAAILGIMF